MGAGKRTIYTKPLCKCLSDVINTCSTIPYRSDRRYEWENPNVEVLQHILSYSPYDNIKRKIIRILV